MSRLSVLYQHTNSIVRVSGWLPVLFIKLFISSLLSLLGGLKSSSSFQRTLTLTNQRFSRSSFIRFQDLLLRRMPSPEWIQGLLPRQYESSDLCIVPETQSPNWKRVYNLTMIYLQTERIKSEGDIHSRHAKWYQIKYTPRRTQSCLMISPLGSLPEPDPACLSSISGFFPIMIPAWSSPIATP